VEILTGSPIKQFLPENLPSTRERVPDLIGILADGRPLHLEFMSYNDPFMAERMYDVRGYFRHANRQLPALKQVVLYVGKEQVNMPDCIEEEDLLLRYTVIDIRSYSAALFLESEAIADNLIGVLCDGGATREYVVATLQRIAALESKTAMRDATQKLLTLSSKRDCVKTVFEEGGAMPFTIERGDDSFIDALWDEAEQKGRVEGKLEGQIAMVRKIVELRFGPLPRWASDRLSTATQQSLDSLPQRLYTAKTLEDVFS
jgi:hypothetical protein